jgi:hypothetical protein
MKTNQEIQNELINYTARKVTRYDLEAQQLLNEKPNGFYCENCFKENLTNYIETQNGTIVCCEKCLKEWEESLKIQTDLNIKKVVGK